MNRIEQLKIFLKKEPKDAFLQYALATEYVAQENDDMAFHLFTKLIDEQPEYSATYYHLGKLLERKGNRKEAEATYHKGLEITAKNNERHANRELNNALNELLFDE